MRRMLHRVIGGLAILILLSQNGDALQKIRLSVAEHGDNVTLTCRIATVVTAFYLNKIKFGYLPQVVATGYGKVSVREQFTSRFTATKEDFLYRFVIRNVSKEDEATYFCQAGTAYNMSFTDGTTLVVNDKGLSSVHIKQSKSVHLDGSATFQCSLRFKKEESGDACQAEHSAFLFRAGSGESHPNIIYTPSHSRHEQDGRRCFYTLTKIANVSDTGTYYCAVDACGQILFGGGSTLQPTDAAIPFVTVIGILSACCTMVLAALIISRSKNPVLHCRKGRAAVLTTDHSSAEDPPENAEVSEANYVILDFFSRKTKSQAANMDLPQTCIYSGIRG